MFATLERDAPLAEVPAPVPAAGPQEDLVRSLDAMHSRIGEAQLGLLTLVAKLDRCGSWEETGARDAAHWLSMRYGISGWKAHRWIAAGHALGELPAIAAALAAGELGIDKVLELCRFATPDTEAGLLQWAGRVSCAAVRRRGDRAQRVEAREVEEAERARTLSWWHVDEGRRMGLAAELPAAQGAVVVRAIERMAERVPQMPEEDRTLDAPARPADALVAICSASIARDPDQDRATVVVHAEASVLAAGGGAEIEGGGVLPRESLERLICDARVQTVVEDADGDVVHLGRMRRDPPPWMLRQVRHRDRGCRFPGCGAITFTQVHHILWWSRGGRTDLDNLLLLCSFHHRLVHEYGWSVQRDKRGTVRWFRRDGTRYRNGPSPQPRLE